MQISKINFNFSPKVSFRNTPNGNDFQLKQISSDTFEMQKKELYPLTKKYNLNVDDIVVKSTEPFIIDNNHKKVFIERLLKAHELAYKNVDMGQSTGVGYASNVCLSDNSWHLGTNFNGTRNESVSICGERAAITNAYNYFIVHAKPGQSIDDFKIKYIAMSSAKDIGTDESASRPCADCLSWFNTTKSFDDDTKIVYFTKDKKTGKMFLEFKTLKELLPMRGNDAIDSVFNEEPANIKAAPVVLSIDAQRIMDEKGITTQDIRDTLFEAKNVFEGKDFASYSKQNMAVCAKTGNEYFTASKIDWTKRWYVEPARFTLAKACEKYNKAVAPDIIAYYGENMAEAEKGETQDGIVSIQTLGRIKAIDKNSEPLIALINGNDEIEVHSINDYMPSVFKQTYVE